MNFSDSGVIIFLALQTGALIWNLASLKTIAMGHEDRIKVLEQEQRQCPLRFPQREESRV
jgi:hypothetical protein